MASSPWASIAGPPLPKHSFPASAFPCPRCVSLEEGACRIARVRLVSFLPAEEEVDVSGLSSDGVQRLRVNKDPFLYHSIPEVHRNCYRFDEDVAAIDVATVLTRARAVAADTARQRSSCPPALAEAAAEGAAATVGAPAARRVRGRRRVSVEAHPDVMMGGCCAGARPRPGRSCLRHEHPPLPVEGPAGH